MDYFDEVFDAETEKILERLEDADYNSLEYVRAFSEILVLEGLTTGFHPDTPFENYTDAKGTPVYTPEDARIRNIVLEHCFEVCERENVCIYEITGRITLRGTPFETMFDPDHEVKYAEFMRKVELGEKVYSSCSAGDIIVKEMFQAHYN